MEYPYNLTKEEVVRQITEIYQADYNLNNPSFDVYDQLLACEAIDESERECKKDNKTTNENVSANGSDNGSYKRKVNFDLSTNQLKVAENIKECSYQTPPIEISNLLEEFFKEYKSKDNHWLWNAQTYTARTINQVMSATIKKYRQGGIRSTLPAYFTYLLKFRKKRKEFRSTNDNH